MMTPNLEHLPLLRMRNIPSKLNLRQKIDFVCGSALPDQRDPAQFVATLTAWEKELGTVHATLGGLLTVFQVSNHEEVIEGFTLFEDCRGKTARFFAEKAELDWEWLRQAAEAYLIFSNQTDCLEGLRSFSSNLTNVGRKGVGNCVVSAATMALLFMSHDFLAGEAHFICTLTTPYRHSRAYFPDFKKTFDLGDFPPRFDAPFEELIDVFAIGSSFSFISSLIISEIAKNLHEGALDDPTRRADYLRWLKIAEAVNPFNYYLFSQRKDLTPDPVIYEQSGSMAEMIGELRGDAIHFL